MHKVGVRVAVLLLVVTAAATTGFAVAGQQWVIAGVAALWCAGGCARLVPTRTASSPAAVSEPVTATRPLQSAANAAAASHNSRIDLHAAAAICTALARITRTSDLPPLLARAANLCDAAGIILWMGAGDHLFAATAHGYPSDVLTRLGPIARSADNATASAWRSGQLTTVAGDAATNGALVVPIFGADACVGALAIELRHARERNPEVHAVASMIAAQLAGVVPAWPTASTPEIHSATA